MSYESYTKRTIYVAQCLKCGVIDTKLDNPPKEILCKCGEWAAYHEESYIGKDRFNR